MPSYYSTTATRKRKTKGLTAADRAARVEHDKYLRSLGIDPKKRKVAQPGSAPALGAGGREFEPCYLNFKLEASFIEALLFSNLFD